MGEKNFESLINDQNIVFFDQYTGDYAEGSPERRILDVFMYGTWKDYKEIEATIPEELRLSARGYAAGKLRMLTILTLCTEKDELTFDELIDALEIENIVDIENLVCDMIATGLIQGWIDEQTRTVSVSYSASRSIRNDPQNIRKIREKILQMRLRIKDELSS